MKSKIIRVDQEYAKKLEEEANKLGLKIPQFTRLKLKKWKKADYNFKI